MAWEFRNYLSSEFYLGDRNSLYHIFPKLQKSIKKLMDSHTKKKKKRQTSGMGINLAPPSSLLMSQAHLITSPSSHPGQASLWLLVHFTLKHVLMSSAQCHSAVPRCPSTSALQCGPSQSVLYMVLHLIFCSLSLSLSLHIAHIHVFLEQIARKAMTAIQ